MLRRPRTDFWQVGIVPAPIEQVSASRLRELREHIVWLPPAGPWRYLADPFGLQRGDTLHVFVEAYDHRRKHAVIERHDLDLPGLQWRACRTVLERPFHLSYPFVFEHQGIPWMVPESAQAGEIALYRGDEALQGWRRECALLPGVPGADASLIRHQGRWWMFHAIVGAGGRDQQELHLAHAPDLFGPWQPHPGNPVRVDRAAARPAGRPFVDADGHLRLPVQDCAADYGSALCVLRFTHLAPDRVEHELLDLRLTGDLVSADHTEGFHTLTACGPCTLIDVKRVDRSRMKQWLDLKRRARRLLRKLAA